MTPPIDGMEVTAENAPKILKTDEFRDLKEEELVILLNAKRHENLLNKPNMTPTDKANMEKSIKFLIDKKMDTEENLKKLEAINYGSNYIEIGGVKRARQNLKVEPNGENIFKHGDEVYFKFDALKEQNKLLDKQGMKLPGKDDFTKALKALPGDFTESNWYTGANILGNILDLPMSGFCGSGGELYNKGIYGYVWSSSENVSTDTWDFGFSEDGGRLGWNDRGYARPVRPVLKSA